MAFKKTKKTFLSQAGRRGAPSVLKPFAQKNTKATLRRAAASNSQLTNAPTAGYVVRNGRQTKTGKVNSRPNSHTTGKTFNIDQRLSKYFMSVGPKLSSATNSPQTTGQAFKPKG